MKKNKKQKINCNNMIPCFRGRSLIIPTVIAILLVIVSIVVMLSSGSLYRYNWILLPKGAFPLAAFIITYITVIALLGGALGCIISDRMYKKSKYKLLASVFTVAVIIVMLLWYNIIFTSFAFFCGFLFSVISLAISILTSFVIYKNFKSYLLLIMPAIVFNVYILWLSFSIMLIN